MAADRSAYGGFMTPDLRQVINGQYQLTTVLGRGGFGTVYHAIDRSSGQAVAELMEQHVGEQPLSSREIWEGTAFTDEPAPLWYYVLREAEYRRDGRCLGPVGARIVAEVLIGLTRADPESFLHAPGWSPTLPSRRQCDFTMADLLRFAGVA